MKKMFLIVALVAATTLVNAQEIKKVKATEVVTMIEKSTNPLIINFWATWCPPCVRELNYFEKVINKFKDKNVELVLISLDYPEDYEKIISFVKAKGYKAKVDWLDEQETSVIQSKIDEGFEGVIPASLFVNKATNYRKFHSGQLTESGLKKEIEKLVKE
jgi:thiol-disulfide isomerase/thioredoxin